MLEAVTTGLGTVIDWIGTVVNSMTTTDGALADLLPLFAVGISISIVFLGIKGIKSIVWGA